MVIPATKEAKEETKKEVEKIVNLFEVEETLKLFEGKSLSTPKELLEQCKFIELLLAYGFKLGFTKEDIVGFYLFEENIEALNKWVRDLVEVRDQLEIMGIWDSISSLSVLLKNLKKVNYPKVKLSQKRSMKQEEKPVAFKDVERKFAKVLHGIYLAEKQHEEDEARMFKYQSQKGEEKAEEVGALKTGILKKNPRQQKV